MCSRAQIDGSRGGGLDGRQREWNIHDVRNKNTLGRDTYKCPSLLRVGGGELVLVPRGPGLVGTSEKGSEDTTRQRGSNLGESRCEHKGGRV